MCISMIEIITKWPKDIRTLVEEFNRGASINDEKTMSRITRTIFETLTNITDPELRKDLLWAGSLIAKQHPTQGVPHIDQVTEIVADKFEDAFAKMHALDFLRGVGREKPVQCANTVEPIVMALNDDFDLVRYAAAQALGEICNDHIEFLDKPLLVRELRLAESDPDMRVRGIIQNLRAKLGK